MPRLKLKLVRIENVVVMLVLEQKERRFSFKAKNGWVLEAASHPALPANDPDNHVYVRGSNNRFDSTAAVQTFCSPDAAKLFVAQLSEAVREYCASDKRDVAVEPPEVVIVGE